jgi:hypothetical protein
LEIVKSALLSTLYPLQHKSFALVAQFRKPLFKGFFILVVLDTLLLSVEALELTRKSVELTKIHSQYKGNNIHLIEEEVVDKGGLCTFLVKSSVLTAGQNVSRGPF